MKIRQKLLLLLIGILVCLLLFVIVQIYAKYVTSASGTTSFSISKWNLAVNNLSVQNNSDLSTTIVPVFFENEHISNDIIAPTSKGYFDLILDLSNVDVSFKYEIIARADENSSVKDLVSTGYSIDGGEIINFENYNDPISEIITLSSDIDSRNIRIYIEWNDSESQLMDNSEDTLSTTTDTPALFFVNVSFTQITEDTSPQNETI